MPSALLKRVEKYLEVARTNGDAELTDALHDIVDAIRILDAKLMTVQRQEVLARGRVQSAARRHQTTG
jgi:hypothetical protein